MTTKKTANMMSHPLREKLTKDDWVRIQKVWDNELPDSHATTEEIDAAHDVFYDAIAGHTQTHLGVLTLQ